jgi:citrate lyase subunit beta / citryl-CoA lyase
VSSADASGLGGLIQCQRVLPVTYLFVPGPEERKVHKALTSGADAVILDLEDAVPPAEKDAARSTVASLIADIGAEQAPDVWIRINGAEPEFSADLDGIDWRRVAGAVLPKAEDASKIDRLARAGARRLLPLIESAAGLDHIRSLARASERVERLAIGTYDLALDLGLHAIDNPDDSELIWQLRGQLVVQSRVLNLAPPIDGVFPAFHNDEGLRRACTRAHQLGFGGKLLIHPNQLAAAREIFGLSSKRVEQARAIVAAYEAAEREGRGAIQVDGHMVDRVMVDRARALIESSDKMPSR